MKVETTIVSALFLIAGLSGCMADESQTPEMIENNNEGGTTSSDDAPQDDPVAKEANTTKPVKSPEIQTVTGQVLFGIMTSVGSANSPIQSQSERIEDHSDATRERYEVWWNATIGGEEATVELRERGSNDTVTTGSQSITKRSGQPPLVMNIKSKENVSVYVYIDDPNDHESYVNLEFTAEVTHFFDEP